MGYYLTIEYLNGQVESLYCDDCSEGDQCLMYHIRFGEKAGLYHVPYKNIKKYRIQR